MKKVLLPLGIGIILTGFSGFVNIGSPLLVSGGIPLNPQSVPGTIHCTSSQAPPSNGAGLPLGYLAPHGESCDYQNNPLDFYPLTFVLDVLFFAGISALILRKRFAKTS